MDETIGIAGCSQRLLELVQSTSRASRQLRRRLGELAAQIELTDSELLVVWLCRSPAAGLVQGDLAEAVGISPAQMSSVAERLRQRGLLAMQRSPLDRRRQVWHSTPAARGLLTALHPQLAALAEHFDALVPPAEQRMVIALGEQLAAAAETSPAAETSSSAETGAARHSPFVEEAA